MVEDFAEVLRSWPFDTRLRGHLSVVRKHTGVIKQLLLIDIGLGNVPKTRYEELQDAPMVGRQQFPEWIHTPSRSPRCSVVGRRRRRSVDRVARCIGAT